MHLDLWVFVFFTHSILGRVKPVLNLLGGRAVFSVKNDHKRCSYDKHTTFVLIRPEVNEILDLKNCSYKKQRV